MRLRAWATFLPVLGWLWLGLGPGPVPGIAQDDDRLVRGTEALSPAEEEARLRVPDGFSIGIFASEPMINKPVNLAFDAKGRLWVSSTVEYPMAAERARWEDELGSRVRGSRDAIKVLEDNDGDGKADRVTDFADGLNIPTGVLPWTRPGDAAGCIAWSIPNIWYFGDRDGDGRCDTREPLFGPLGYERDTHGMCSSFRLGRDGWVYATHGFSNVSRFRVRPENLRGARPGDPGTELDLHSGSVFRFLPDGSRIEAWSWGQVNPFGLAWDRRGQLYSADCHSAPVYQLLRGAHYPSFGKPHDGLGFGPAMCSHSHGSTGICGIVFLDDGRWGAAWNDRIFLGNVVTSRVNHDRIEWRGSTPVAVEQPDLIVSGDPWFRPVDLQWGPDGDLFVADFYNRIIGHYEVPLDHPGRDRERGRIWRLRFHGRAGPRPGGEPRGAVTEGNALERLESGSPHERREAAALLQSSPRPEAVEPLLGCLLSTPAPDSHLIHALKLSLREHLSLPGAFAALGGIDPVRKRALLPVALAVEGPAASAFLLDRLRDGMVDGDPDRLAILRHLGRHGDEAATAGAVGWARASGDPSPEIQAGRLAALHEGRLEREGPALTPELNAWAVDLARALLPTGNADPVSDWLAETGPEASGREPAWILQERMAESGETIQVLSSLRRGEARAEQRTGTLRSREFPAPPALDFWLCGHRGPPGAPAHSLNRVRLVQIATGAVIASAFPPRSDTAVRVTWDLAGVAGEPVRLEIVDGDAGGAFAWLAIGGIKPEVLRVESFAGSEARDRGLGILAGLLRHTAPPDLREALSAWLPSHPAAPPAPVDPARRAELDRLIAARVAEFAAAKPDPDRGADLFRTHCAACHRIGGEGGLVGPQLDGIGRRGLERLCEDILDPNRQMDVHFHLQAITLGDGRVVGGFVRDETDRVLRILDASGKEHAVAKPDVVARQVNPVSLMPANFGEVLDPGAFRDLVGWLIGR